MLERFAANPLSAISGCLIWIPIAIAAVCLVQWMVAADIDFVSGIAGLFVCLFLGLVALDPPQPWMSGVAFTSMLSTVILYPAVRAYMNHHQLNMVDVDSMEDIYEGLRERPDNAALKLRMARILYVKGMVGHAITIAEDSLQKMPRTLFADEHRMVQTWKRSAKNPEYFRSLPCLSCSFSNPPGQILCQRCGNPFFIDLVRGRWVSKGLGRKLLTAWGSLLALALGIPFVSAKLSPTGTLIVVPLLILMVAVILVVAFRAPERQTA
jgi:hypothetical protein